VAEHDDADDNTSRAGPVDEPVLTPAAPGSVLAAASADAYLEALFEDFSWPASRLRARRKPRRPTGGDLAAISAQLPAPP
jgi:hypothetical protein